MADEERATTEESAEEEKAKPAPKKRTTRKRASTAKSGSGSTRRRSSAKAADDAAPAAEAADEKPAAEAKKSKPAAQSRPKTRLEQQYADEVVAALTSEFGYKNPMEVPYPTKIVLNIGLGETIQAQGRQNLDIIQKASDDLETITGQHPVVTKARMSIANFKLREGMPVGVTVTLRGLKMWQFLDRLVNVALPRVRDFHGVSRNSFDSRGNYSLGLSEQIIFPEIDYNRIDRLRGLQAVIVTSARNDEEARRLLELLGMPFERVEDQVAAAV